MSTAKYLLCVLAVLVNASVLPAQIRPQERTGRESRTECQSTLLTLSQQMEAR